MSLYGKATGLSQKALAQNIGIDRQTIIRCESGETVMLLYRKAMGLSQKVLAQNIGINRQTIIRCESGEREPQLTAAQWKRLCRSIKKQLGPAVMLHFIESDDSPDLSSFDVSEAQAVLGEKLKALASKDSFV